MSSSKGRRDGIVSPAKQFRIIKSCSLRKIFRFHFGSRSHVRYFFNFLRGKLFSLENKLRFSAIFEIDKVLSQLAKFMVSILSFILLLQYCACRKSGICYQLDVKVEVQVFHRHRYLRLPYFRSSYFIMLSLEVFSPSVILGHAQLNDELIKNIINHPYYHTGMNTNSEPKCVEIAISC